MNDWSDLLGVLAVVGYLAGFGAISVRMLLLHARRTRPDRRRSRAYLLAGLTLTYLLFVLADVPGVLTLLSNRVDDIPPASTARTSILATILWVMHALLDRPVRGRAA